jgi:uncharacterized PurR-regulated membrane protein YhhQ (DUF165 family)
MHDESVLLKRSGIQLLKNILSGVEYVIINGALISMIGAQYSVKIIVALIDTPFVYLGAKWTGVPEEFVKRHR